MSEDEKELLENYREMSPENKAHLLSLAHTTKATQINTLKTKALNKKAAIKGSRKSA